MDKIFIDTSIILDLLLERHPDHKYAAHLFTLADKGNIEIYISSLCFSHLDYIISKQHNKSETRRILIRFKLLVNILSVDDKIISLALSSSFSDFEDAIQYYTALENNIPILITRNLKDYKKTSISMMTAEMYLQVYK